MIEEWSTSHAHMCCIQLGKCDGACIFTAADVPNIILSCLHVVSCTKSLHLQHSVHLLVNNEKCN